VFVVAAGATLAGWAQVPAWGFPVALAAILGAAVLLALGQRRAGLASVQGWKACAAALPAPLREALDREHLTSQNPKTRRAVDSLLQ